MASSRSQSSGVRLRDARRVFRLVGEIRELRDRPTAQRRHVIEAVRSLVGEGEELPVDFQHFKSVQWRRIAHQLTGRPPEALHLRWFANWMAEGASGGERADDVREAVVAAPATEHGRRVVNLLIRELYRLHTEGKLTASEHEPPLTMRQQEVLKRMLTGQSAKAIAYELGISQRTVEEYMRGLYERFDVTTRAELMALFIDGAERPRSVNGDVGDAR